MFSISVLESLLTSVSYLIYGIRHGWRWYIRCIHSFQQYLTRSYVRFAHSSYIAATRSCIWYAIVIKNVVTMICIYIYIYQSEIFFSIRKTQNAAHNYQLLLFNISQSLFWIGDIGQPCFIKRDFGRNRNGKIKLAAATSCFSKDGESCYFKTEV